MNREKIIGSMLEQMRIMATVEILGNDIQQISEHAYKQLTSACRPVIRSNGVKEWTVLSSVVAVDRHNNDLRLVNIATGVKSTPDTELKRSNGKILHDCHAEILAIRGLNKVLLEHVCYLINSKKWETDLIIRNKHDNSFQLKDKWDLALYISALPCGDASMSCLTDETSSSNCQVVVEEEDEVQYTDIGNKTILRGRMNYKKLGVVRTKPGRLDSVLTLSKSCSDKLCVKQATSILNCLTWSLFARPIFLTFLVVPIKNNDQMEDLQRNFNKRLKGLAFTPIHILNCTTEFIDAKHDINQEPSAMSSIKLYFLLPSLKDVEQAILNGLKNGFYTKAKKPLRKNCETIISKYSQWNLFRDVILDTKTDISYNEFKNSQLNRQSLIDTVRNRLSPDGWIRTHIDDI